MSVAQLTERFVDWLEQSRVRYVNAAREEGIELLRSAERTLVHFQEPFQGTFGFERYQYNALGRRDSLGILNERTNGGLDGVSRLLAAALYETYGDKCRYWDFNGRESANPFTGLTGPPFETEPIGWIETSIVMKVLYAYIAGQASPQSPNEPLARRLVAELLKFIEEDSWVVQTSMPLRGVWSEEEQFASESISLRRLAPEEAGQFLNASRQGPANQGLATAEEIYHTLVRPSLMGLPSHLLEARSRSPKNQSPRSKGEDGKFLLAPQLLGFDPRTDTATISLVPEWITSMRFVRKPDLPHRGEDRILTRSDFDSAIELSREIPEGAIAQPRKSQEVALHRFSLGASRDAVAVVDSVLDYIIALEAVLAEGVTSEIAFRFRLNGALLLARSLEERLDIHQRLKELYNKRSVLVHGSKRFPSFEQLKELRHEARALSSQVLRRCLTEGWPSQEEFLRLAMESPGT